MALNKIIKLFLFTAISLPLIACGDNNKLIHQMNSSEEDFNRRQTTELSIYMTLERMFPDSSVRRLAKAAGEGEISAVVALASQGVDVNFRGINNTTPLFWAMRNNFEGFKQLLMLGADPNVIFDDGGSVLHWAARHQDERFLIEALKFGGDPNLVAGVQAETPLFRSIAPGDKKLALILLEAGADINVQKKSGDTVLMVAARLGQFDLVYELLQRGADFAVKNQKGHDLLGIIEFRKRTMDPNNQLSEWLKKVIIWLGENQ